MGKRLTQIQVAVSGDVDEKQMFKLCPSGENPAGQISMSKSKFEVSWKNQSGGMVLPVV